MSAMRKIITIVLVLVVTNFTSLSKAGTQGSAGFVFEKPDLALLEQSNLLDERFAKEGLIFSDRSLESYLERVATSVLPPGPPPERVKWRFNVLREPLPNAFALPNGSVYATTGLLALLENEDQLASVLAHEIAHVSDRHSYIAQRSYRKKMVAINIFQAAGGFAPVGGWVGATLNMIGSTIPAILTATIYGYDRKLEKDADLYAVNRLMESPYDAREMANTFRLLEKDYELERVTLFYSDHPALEERLSYVTAAITKVNAESVDSQAAAENRARYLSTTERGAQHDIALEIQSGRFRTAHALSQKLLKFNPMSSENCYYSAESYRALGPRPAEPTTRELSPEGRKENARLKQKYLVEEQEKLLIATAGGQEVFKDNIAKAEAMYRRSIELDPKNPKPHRSLAVLLEKSERYSEALEEHRRYLELEPKALDRALVERQVEALRTRLAAGKN